MDRIILHGDLDAFYASVEQLDNPELRDKPVVVGGSPEGRGVVMAASYEARRFGVRSAMPMSRALRLCPQAVRVAPRFERYTDLSRQVMAIFRAVTPLVEPLSLDEAFLDVSAQAQQYGGGEGLARHLKGQVNSQTGLTLSVGVGSSKTVAKIASDHGKPDGLVVVPSGQEAAFLAPLPVRALWGVGPKTEARLGGLVITTIGDLAGADADQVTRLVGSWGPVLQAMARGIDDRAVTTQHERKSVGAERTFARDLADGPELREELARVVSGVARRLQRSGAKAQTVALKLRYANFQTITRQRSLQSPTAETTDLLAVGAHLLDEAATPGARFRLIGIHASRLAWSEESQSRLWPD